MIEAKPATTPPPEQSSNTAVKGLFNQALQLHQQGQWEQARVGYLEVLQQQAGHLDALHLLGVIALQSGQAQSAIAWIEKAIAANDRIAAFHVNLGRAYQSMQQPEQALACFDKAIALQATLAEAHFNRGNVLQLLLRHAEAPSCYEKAVALQPTLAAAYYNWSEALQKLGQPEQALACLDAHLQLQPGDAKAYQSKGQVLKSLGQPEAALHSYEQCLALDPAQTAVWLQHGLLLQELQRQAAALHSFEQAIAHSPRHAKAHCLRGIVLQHLARRQEAIASLEQAIALEPDLAEAHASLGWVLHSLQRHAEALDSCNRALILQPDFAQALANRGLTLQALQRPQEALADYDRAITLQPDMALIHSNRGLVLLDLNRPEEALNCQSRALSLQPDLAQAFCNRGMALQALQRDREALADFDRAIALQPNYPEAHAGRGNALVDLHQLAEALPSLDRAIALQPDSADNHLNKAIALLGLGQLGAGWRLYEWRWKTRQVLPFVRNFAQPVWLGDRPLQGKTVLLHCEQGLGDSIQFCRYACMVKDRGAHVLLEVPQSLHSLLSKLDGVDQCLMQGQPLPPFDLHCPLLSLPLAFQTELHSIPSPHAYLHSQAAKRAEWAARLGPRHNLRIGLMWNGSPGYGNSHLRSMALADMLVQLPPGPDYVSLQKEVRASDMSALQASGIRHFGEHIHDFSDTAALCDLMDIVISVDTSVGHLAGALGRPTWLLLRHSADWRWLLERDDSPWYAAMRLYRQDEDQQWAPVLARVAAALRRMANLLA